MSLKTLNPNADRAGKGQAMTMNVNAAKGLQDVLRTNLGPRGTLKMLVGGSGDIKLTKDGSVLLAEMQIQNPTAAMIARTASAQDAICGDGTTSTVILIGELMRQAERYLVEGVHPRVISDGFDIAKEVASNYVDSCKKEIDPKDRELLISTALTSLRTKLADDVAAKMTDVVVDSVLAVWNQEKEVDPIDLHMVEIMHMQHKRDLDTRLVRGLVLDHGARHPDMPKKVENCFVLTCNVSLEFERSEVNAGFFYNKAGDKAKLAESEREWVDKRCRKIVELKREVCGDGEGFVVLNQKGIDPMSLDMLAHEGIFALRRVKRRNMERLTLACGGSAINSFDDLTPDVLGHADTVQETTLGDDKFTFVEGVPHSDSCTVLITGPHKHTIAQIKEAVRDGLRAVKNTVMDAAVLPGAGAFEVGCAEALYEHVKTLEGKSKVGVQAFADAMLIVPKVIAENSGFDAIDTIIKLQEEQRAGHMVGVDVESGGSIDPIAAGIYDSVLTKRQGIHSCAVISTQFLLVDEIMRAGKARGPK